MIKDSLFEKYVFERLGRNVFWSEFGFVEYKISGEECYLANIFVDEDKRSSGRGRDLVNSLSQIASDHMCKTISANIHLCDKNANDTLLKAMKVGFRVVASGNDVLLISKNIKEDSNG